VAGGRCRRSDASLLVGSNQRSPEPYRAPRHLSQAPRESEARQPPFSFSSRARRGLEFCRRVEAIQLEKPPTERFWMANSPIGGYQPKASRLIVTLHTDAGISGHGEGSGGANILRRGFADLVLGEDPFMVGKIREKMFAVTYGREPSSRGWTQTEVIAAMAPIDAAIYDIYDIMAQAAGLPVYKFLGGYRDTVPVYVTGGYYREGFGREKASPS